MVTLEEIKKIIVEGKEVSFHLTSGREIKMFPAKVVDLLGNVHIIYDDKQGKTVYFSLIKGLSYNKNK